MIVMIRPFFRFKNYFWAIDPGYFNLKHATKTILAVLISLCLVHEGDTLTLVSAAIASGASMQVVVASSLVSRIVQVVIFDVVYFAALVLGFSVRDFPSWTAVTLVILGFVVNYIRRFGLDNSMAPMMIWVLCFITTILPFADTTQVWVLIHAVWVGFLVSAVILIFIFPENYPRLFVSNSNLFFDGLTQGLLEMRRYVLVPNTQEVFINLPFVSIKTTLDRLLESNQTIQQQVLRTHDEKQISHILMHQYGLLNAYSLMIDVYHSLWVSKHSLSRAGALALSYVSKDFADLFSATRVNMGYMVATDRAIHLLPKLATVLGNISLVEPNIIMALLNFKLSFELLNQHETLLLRAVDEA